MRGFCCGAGELEISSGVAPQQTEVKFQALSFTACEIQPTFKHPTDLPTSSLTIPLATRRHQPLPPLPLPIHRVPQQHSQNHQHGYNILRPKFISTRCPPKRGLLLSHHTTISAKTTRNTLPNTNPAMRKSIHTLLNTTSTGKRILRDYHFTFNDTINILPTLCPQKYPNREIHMHRIMSSRLWPHFSVPQSKSTHLIMIPPN